MGQSMRPLLAVFAAFLLITGHAQSQSVRPAIAEYTSPSEGRFDVVNDSLLPMFITIEPKSFTIDAQGTAQFTRLDPGIHLQLSQNSLRLPPRSSRTIFYTATANAYPAWFCIYSNFAGTPRRGFMNVELELPHTVYLLGKGKSGEDAIQVENLRREDGQLHGTVRNRSGNVVRLQSIQVIDGNGKKREEGGFPLLPGGSRQLSLPLKADETPSRVRIKFGRYTAEGSLP